jgi:hypothetical protein
MLIRRSPNGAGHTRPQPGRDRSEQVVAINRNAWSQSIGIGGRNQPVRAASAERFRYSLGSRPGVWKPSASGHPQSAMIVSKLNRSIRSGIAWHIEINPQSDRLLDL